ncbi:MAG: amidohydrolase family protein [Thermodesulfobacteriota bacterium]
MIIDFHTHLFPPDIREGREKFFDREPDFQSIYSHRGSKLAGVEELIGNMDEQGVDKSVVFGFPWRSPGHFKINNDYIIEAVERYPNRLIGFCTFYLPAKGVETELERCLNFGLSGVGELAFYSSALGEDAVHALRPIAEIALSFDVPVLLHTNEPIGHIYPGKAPMTVKDIYQLVQAFPRNKIVLAHWGGGMLFYYLMKKEVKSVLANTWFDTAASPYLYDSRMYALAAEIVGLQKILFGSDFPLLKPSRYFKEMKEALLPSDTIAKICGENAASLLKRKETEKRRNGEMQ